jgi:hypothetical protein
MRQAEVAVASECDPSPDAERGKAMTDPAKDVAKKKEDRLTVDPPF